MDLRQSLLELKSQVEYLASLKKEDVTHIIKSSIYEIENLEVFREEELKELNKVILTNEAFHNLYFKYNKERLITKGVVYLEEENDLQFLISLFYFFKQRVPILLKTNTKLQIQSLDIIQKFLKENNISGNFLIKIND
ncbi:MAG: hypothetical protein ACJ0RM_00605 [Alphaproteobacteria bacterium]|tara:strand:- start:165 stop:578 length:414 start_codon:yes stop_codon:yes gene_type:complete